MWHPIDPKTHFLCSACVEIQGGWYLCQKAYYWHLEKKILKREGMVYGQTYS